MSKMVLTSMPRSTSAIDTRPKMYLIEVPRRVAFMDVGRTGSSGHVNMNSTEDEMDNPFRPGSELSREADIIVNLIKEGKPITPTRDMVDGGDHPQQHNSNSTNGLSSSKSANLQSSPPRNGPSSPAKVAPGVVEVQHGIVVPPSDKCPQVEQVTLKKKRKCCTIQ